jgi:hypothetical protein
MAAIIVLAISLLAFLGASPFLPPNLSDLRQRTRQ